MANVTLLHYNNYFNRIVKKEASYAAYLTADPNYNKTNNINFVPGDGVTTSLVLGTSSLLSGYDYLLVSELENSVEVVKSRWFVMEDHRTRDGQYEISLKRDLIADYYDETVNATTYIEKGFISPENKLIFNSEGLALNQIKKEEYLLKDRTNCPWLIAYISKSQGAETCNINYEPANVDYINVSASSLENWTYYDYINNPFYGVLSNPTYRIDWQKGTDGTWHYGHFKTVISSTGIADTSGNSDDDWTYALRTPGNADTATVNSSIQTQWRNVGSNNINATLNTSLGCHTNEEIAALRYYDGKTIKTQDGKFYQISIHSVSGISYSNTLITNLSLPIAVQVQNIIRATGEFSPNYNTLNDRSLRVSCSAPAWQITATEVPSKEVTLSFSGTRNKTIDALYDIIAIPYGEVSIGQFTGSGTQTFTELFKTNRNLGMATMNSIATKFTTANVYDVQLLPYFPLQADIAADGKIAIDTSAVGTKFSYVVDNSTNPATNVGIVFYIKESDFSLDIEKELTYERAQIITGFDPVPAPTQQYEAWFKENVKYVFQNLNNPTSSWSPSFPTYRLGTLDSSGPYTKNTNGLKILKINKVSGNILETYYAHSVEVELHSDETLNVLTIKNLDNTTLETYVNSSYVSLDYYIEFIIVSNAYGGSRLELMAEVVKLPIINNTISDSYSLKISNECEIYKLVSPNYQGEFEFSVAKNYGVERFNVDCTYKPYNPYIHVNPNFKPGGLYGNDFNDGRGLICNGDFSFGMIGDKFAEYELQNKNYQAIFNRQVQNMDVNNAIAREQQAWSGVAGALTGGVAGAVAGGTKGGVWGAVGGAAAGLTTGAIGASLDWNNLVKSQTEARSFATDMYRYSLQNIQALPYSLSKCNAITSNNKLFPFIEYYTCSNEEEEAFLNKLKYDGMSVLAIGKIKDYLDISEKILIRGELIRFNSDYTLTADSHVAEEIYNELKKGVYI